MSSKIVINPKYQECKDFVVELPNSFNDITNVVQARRNIIKEVNVNHLTLNVKCYRKPIFINRIIYTFFRKSKAFKAYYNAIEVEKRGFSTPSSVAYIEQKQSGLLALSYFVSIQLTNVREIRDYYYSKAEQMDLPFLSSFAKYTANLHNAGILHLDYSPGNILFEKKDKEEYKFSLVDINRMSFHNVSIEEGCRNFCRLFEHDEVIKFISQEYSQQRGLDSLLCEKLMLHYKQEFEKKKEWKRKIKGIFRKSKS